MDFELFVFGCQMTSYPMFINTVEWNRFQGFQSDLKLQAIAITLIFSSRAVLKFSYKMQTLPATSSTFSTQN